jgi:hypothetical protein
MDLRVIENRYMLYMYCVHLSACVVLVAFGFMSKQNQRKLLRVYCGYCNFTVIFTLLLRLLACGCQLSSVLQRYMVSESKIDSNDNLSEI